MLKYTQARGVMLKYTQECAIDPSIRSRTQKVWKYAKLASKPVTGSPGAKITAPGEVAPKKTE
jgi:hypothetical protein